MDTTYCTVQEIRCVLVTISFQSFEYSNRGTFDGIRRNTDIICALVKAIMERARRLNSGSWEGEMFASWIDWQVDNSSYEKADC